MFAATAHCLSKCPLCTRGWRLLITVLLQSYMVGPYFDYPTFFGLFRGNYAITASRRELDFELTCRCRYFIPIDDYTWLYRLL